MSARKKKSKSLELKIKERLKPYFVRRNNGQCQILIPLIEMDELVDNIIFDMKGSK